MTMDTNVVSEFRKQVKQNKPTHALAAYLIEHLKRYRQNALNRADDLDTLSCCLDAFCQQQQRC